MSDKRSIKIQSMCGKCAELHEAQGLGGIFAILEKPLKGGTGFQINTGCFSIYSSEEMVNLVYRLLQTTAQEYPAETITALQAFLVGNPHGQPVKADGEDKIIN